MIMTFLESLKTWLHRTETSDYWRESARPLVSLVFVLPILATYEVGIIVFGPQDMCNGADVWLRLLLDRLGLGQHFLLPLLTCFLLYGWHHLSNGKPHIDRRTLMGMGLECVVLAFVLLSLARLQSSLLQILQSSELAPAAYLAHQRVPTALNSTMTVGPEISNGIVGFLGAGIYEELLFRLLLIPAIFAGLCWLGEPPRASLMTAVFVSSLIFAAAHYQIFVGAGESFDFSSFLFRCSAGVFFGILFVSRGFGVAVGVHTIYNILANMTAA